MNIDVHKELRRPAKFLKTFFKWGACAVLVGAICGLVGTAFHYAVALATSAFRAHGWLLYLLPIAGLLIALGYHLCHLDQDPGTNLVIRSIRTPEKTRLVIAPLIFVGTALTHLCGGSSGREGAALQIGGSLGTALGQLFRFEEKDLHVMTMCGMAALFSALFGTPVTAAVFSLEVISVGVLYYSAFLPCVIAALVACKIAALLGVEETSFILSFVPSVGPMVLLKVIVLALAAAMCSILFIHTVHSAHKLYDRFLPNPFLRIAVGGALVVLLTLAVQTRDYNGAGMDVIVRALGGQARPWDFALKILFTALTLGCGFKGGEIVPTFFIGSTLGCVIGTVLGMDPGFAAAIGLICLFCGVVNCPMASLLLAMELFGSSGLPLFAAGVAVSYVMSGYYSLYTGQKIVYSKTAAEYIGRDTKQ